MKKNPKVTVLLPVHNGELFISEAIESVLNQTFTDYEFLIIDDSSTDNTIKIIQAKKDDRIKVFCNDKNLGVIGSLNIGLELARGDYIARMDADDLIRPDRLKIQVDFMDNNPGTGACGSYYETFGNENTFKVDYLETSNKGIFPQFFLFSPIPHPGAMIRKAVIDSNNIRYDVKYIHAEDYKFWFEIYKCSSLANIPEFLLFYRISENQISKKYTKIQSEKSIIIRREIMDYFFSLFQMTFELKSTIEPKDIVRLKNSFNIIAEKNIDSGVFEKEYLTKIFTNLLYCFYTSVSENPIKTVIRFAISFDLMRFGLFSDLTRKLIKRCFYVQEFNYRLI